MITVLFLLVAVAIKVLVVRLALFVTRSTLIRPSLATEGRGCPTPATAGGI
jgi:hypothetical protein